MKQKYYTYASNGNDVVRHYSELKQLRPHVYLTEEVRWKDNYSESWDLFAILGKHKGVYWQVSTIRRYLLERLSMDDGKALLDNLEATIANFYNDLLATAKQNGFINILSIQVCKDCGYDIKPLLESREAYLKFKKKSDRKRYEEYEQRQREKEAEAAKKLVETLTANRAKFLKGEALQPDEFIDMARANGFEIHPRSVSAMRKHFDYFSCAENGMVSFRSTKQGKKCEGVFDAIRNCYKHLQEHQAVQ